MRAPNNISWTLIHALGNSLLLDRYVYYVWGPFCLVLMMTDFLVFSNGPVRMRTWKNTEDELINNISFHVSGSTLAESSIMQSVRIRKLFASVDQARHSCSMFMSVLLPSSWLPMKGRVTSFQIAWSFSREPPGPPSRPISREVDGEMLKVPNITHL